SYTNPTVDYEVKNEKLRKILGWNEPPSISLIAVELLSTIATYHNDKNDSHKLVKAKIDFIYQHLNDIIKSGSENHNIEMLKKILNDKEWVLNGGKVYKTNQLFFDSFSVDQYVVPLSHSNLTNYKDLFKKMGVRNNDKMSNFSLFNDNIVF